MNNMLRLITKFFTFVSWIERGLESMQQKTAEICEEMKKLNE